MMTNVYIGLFDKCFDLINVIFYVSVEEITPKELNADCDFISKCQDCLETRGNTLALFGKLGSGKRTIAAQIAIRLAKEDPKLRIKIVRDRDVLSEDLKTRHSTIIIIHNPVKKWFTSKHADEIIGCLLEICANAKTNNSYIIAIFHYNTWDSFKSQIGNKTTTMEHIFPKKEIICNDMQKFSEMAKSKNIDLSSVRIQSDGRSIGGPVMMTLFLKNRAFQNDNYSSNPTKFIFEKLKTLEKSSELAFKIMVFFVLRDGEIAKIDLKDISQHALVANLKEKMDIERSIDGSIGQLLDLFIEETADGRSYRILHDVITRCTFLAASENHRTILFAECDPILIFDCIREKMGWSIEKIKKGQLVYDFININIGIPSEIYSEIAGLYLQRAELRNVLRNSRLYEEENFQVEWEKAKLLFYKLQDNYKKNLTHW